MRIAVTGLAVIVLVTLAGCDRHEMRTGTPLLQGTHAVALLRTADGTYVGHATATEVVGGLRVTLDIRGLPPGMHGARLHAIGHCDAPDFMTAGGNWPGDLHESTDPRGPRGDLPNPVVGAGGHGTSGVLLPGATMAELVDTDGSAIVVHAEPDDPMTGSAGNGGARIACGVFGVD